MRTRVCIAAVLFVMFLSGCGTVTTMDRWNHFAFSAALSSVGTAATSRPEGSIGITIGAGLIKEVWDGFRGSGFQTGDLLADMAGSLAGGYAAAEICMEEFP